MIKTAIIAKTLGALAVLAAGFGVGFYYLGSQGKSQASQPQLGADAPVQGDQTASLPSTVRRPSAEAGEYTAPGAPEIAIDETPVTSAKPVATPVAAKPGDSEASQTGLPTITTTPALMGTNDGSGQPISPDSSTANQQPGADPSDPSNSAISGSQPSAAATPLGNAGQQGANSPSTPPASQTLTNSGADSSGTGLYHVQAGAFQSEKNAKTLESALQSKGYAAMTVHQFSGGHDSYIVQVGAYSSSVTADQMVGNLQRDGFAASVSRGM